MVCDDVHFFDSVLADLPNVVVDEEHYGIGICGSSKWKRLGDLASLFVGILSHESIHLTLLLNVDGACSDSLDNVASLSSISSSLSDIRLVRRYAHGMIGTNM